MAEKQIPKWMEKQRAENLHAEAHHQTVVEKRRTAASLIEQESANFFRHLLSELEAAVNALPALNLAGQYTPVGLNGVRIDMSKPGIHPNQTYTDLFADQDEIRCTGLGIRHYSLEYRVSEDLEVGVVNPMEGGRLMSFTHASEYVMRRMIDVIQRQDRK